MEGCKGGWKSGWIDKQVGIQVEILFTCLICGLPLILEISPSLFQIFLLSHSPFLSFWYSNTYLTPSKTVSEFLRVVSFLKFPVEFTFLKSVQSVMIFPWPCSDHR